MELLDFCKLHKTIVIYGAGKTGRKLHTCLKALDIEIQDFIVSSVSKQERVDRIPVYSFAEWVQKIILMREL